MAAKKNEYNFQWQIAKFLLSYRTRAHATTGVSPAQLFFGHELCIRLSLVKPNVHDSQQQGSTLTSAMEILHAWWEMSHQIVQKTDVMSESREHDIYNSVIGFDHDFLRST